MHGGGGDVGVSSRGKVLDPQEQVRGITRATVYNGGGRHTQLKRGEGVIGLTDRGHDGVGCLPLHAVNRATIGRACQRAQLLAQLNARGLAKARKGTV